MDRPQFPASFSIADHAHGMLQRPSRCMADAIPAPESHVQAISRNAVLRSGMIDQSEKKRISDHIQHFYNTLYSHSLDGEGDGDEDDESLFDYSFTPLWYQVDCENGPQNDPLSSSSSSSTFSIQLVSSKIDATATSDYAGWEEGEGEEDEEDVLDFITTSSMWIYSTGSGMRLSSSDFSCKLNIEAKLSCDQQLPSRRRVSKTLLTRMGTVLRSCFCTNLDCIL